MHITTETHPHLCAALSDLIHYNGGNTILNPDQNQPNGFNCPSSLDSYLSGAEKGLSALDDDSLMTFIDGEYAEVSELISKDENLQFADKILSHCFDNYENGVWFEI